MIDVKEHRCVDCLRLIPENRTYCYLCDLIKNNKPVNSPKNIKELITEFINNTDTSDWEPEDVIALFDKFNDYVEKKKYRITIQ